MASEDDDNSSLFGSRSPSPALALPTKGGGGVSASSFANIAQNVGTIALPGSQHYSELPNISLALPSSGSLARVPPAALPSLTRSRASSTLSSSTTSSGKQRKQKQKKKHHPSPAPSIALPDPSVTPPPNFLRNQSALLGTAGLVAGLKPAKMQFNIPRGATPTNPIMLDDNDDGPRSCTSSKVTGVVYVENEAPKLGKRSGLLTPSLDIDPALLPAPTTNEIVAMLMAHKDIYPILASIVRLVAGQKAAVDMAQQRKSTRPSSTPITTGPRAPPLKRRRLSRVPAGAVDWDVPYPFQEGEGPEQYQKVWEKERKKQLISQLLDLVRIAARKASVRKYLQQKGSSRRAQRAHSAPASLHGVIEEPTRVSESTDRSLGEPSSSPHRTSQHASELREQPTSELVSTALVPPQPFVPPEPTQETSLSLDQFISSLLANTISGFDFTDSPYVTHDNINPGEDMNESLIDNWMSSFQTFPVHDLAPTLNTLSSPTQIHQQSLSTGSIPIPTLGGTDVHFFDMTSAFNFDSNMQSQSDPISSVDDSLLPPVCDLGVGLFNSSQCTNDNTVACDPTLSLQSGSLDFVGLAQIPTNGTPGSTFSMASANSIRSSSADPSTPPSATWEPAISDVGIAVPESQHLQEPSSYQDQDEVRRFTSLEKEKWPENSEAGMEMDEENGGDGQEPQPRVTTTPPACAEAGVPAPALSSSVSQLALRSSSFPECPRQSKLSKEDIIRFAQARRQELIEELERVKTRLWETTIEQGVLVELQKQLLP